MMSNASDAEARAATIRHVIILSRKKGLVDCSVLKGAMPWNVSRRGAHEIGDVLGVYIQTGCGR